MKHLVLSLFILSTAAAQSQSPSPSPKLAALQASYADSYQQRVTSVHEAAVKTLNTSYASALDRALTAATQAGKLEDALLLRDEKSHVTQNKPLPADPESDPVPLKTLRGTYRTALSKLEATRDQNAAPLKATFDKALAALQSELTKAGDLDGALQVKAARDALPQNAAATVSAPESKAATTAGSQVSAKPKAAKYDTEAAMKIMEWLFPCKGFVVVSTDNGKKIIEAKSKADLPKGKYELIKIFHGHSSQTVPEEPFPWASLEGVPTLVELRLRQKQMVTAADVAHLAALSELTFLHLPSARIDQEAFDAIPPNPKVRHLVIYGTTLSSESSLAKLAARYPNLENLDINRCLPVSPGVVQACAPLKNLKRLCTSGDITSEVAKAIGTMPSLDEWVHTIGTVDETMPPGVFASSLKHLTRLALGDLPNVKVLLPDIIKLEHLWHLGIENGSMEAADVATLSRLRLGSLALADNKTMGDDALAEIAKMRTVKFLDLRGTTVITDAGLVHLAKMKQLEQLQLGPSKITDTGVAALKKGSAELPGAALILKPRKPA